MTNDQITELATKIYNAMLTELVEPEVIEGFIRDANMPPEGAKLIEIVAIIDNQDYAVSEVVANHDGVDDATAEAERGIVMPIIYRGTVRAWLPRVAAIPTVEGSVSK